MFVAKIGLFAPALTPLTFHWYTGEAPPLTGVAVKITFVPAQNLPSVLRTFAEWNPVSAVAQAARELFGNAGAGSGAWSMEHPALYTLVWVGIILAVFVPLSVRRYQQKVNK